MIRCQRHTQRGEAAMPRHQRDCQTTGPCPALGVPGRPTRQRHHRSTNTPGPSAVGAEPAWMDQLLDRLDSRIHTAVNEALNARQAAVSSPTVPATTHLEDVEQAVQASMLASLMVVLPTRQLCPLWAIGDCPPREAAMPLAGLLVSCPPCESSREKLVWYPAKACMPTR